MDKSKQKCGGIEFCDECIYGNPCYKKTSAEMNREEARQYFKDLGLTYDYITLDDLHLLKWILNRNFANIQVQTMKDNVHYVYWHRVNDAKYYKGIYDNNTLIKAQLTGKGGYFDAREVITFNPNGYIGFCGEADKKNTIPVIESFIEWCNHLKEVK